MDDDRLQCRSTPCGNGHIGVLTLPSFYEGGHLSSAERDMREAIKKLKRQGALKGIVLDLRESLTACPKVDGMDIQVIDERTLAASLPKQKSLNTLFAELERQEIHVLSMRNKANRLEELFLGLVETPSDDDGATAGGSA